MFGRHPSLLRVRVYVCLIESVCVSISAAETAVPVQHIFVVNPLACKLRRQHMSNLLEYKEATGLSGLGVPVTFGAVDAFQGNASDLIPAVRSRFAVRRFRYWKEGDPFKARWGRPIAAKDLGATASHWGILESIVNNDISVSLILEDDASLIKPGNVRHLGHALEALLSGVDAALPSWDIFYLWGVHQSSAPQRNITGLFRKGCYSGTVAYMITFHAARKILQMRTEFWARMIAIDDFYMALSGTDCWPEWNSAALHFARRSNCSPYRVLNSVKHSSRLFWHGAFVQTNGEGRC